MLDPLYKEGLPSSLRLDSSERGINMYGKCASDGQCHHENPKKQCYIQSCENNADELCSCNRAVQEKLSETSSSSSKRSCGL
ncbi:hypothetical protein BUE80_DR006964 [Diplocarpon rosae]|nr:hypothetical protein BUE80_DR006964 [Diplocarpon rosae]